MALLYAWHKHHSIGTFYLIAIQSSCLQSVVSESQFTFHTSVSILNFFWPFALTSLPNVLLHEDNRDNFITLFNIKILSKSENLVHAVPSLIMKSTLTFCVHIRIVMLESRLEYFLPVYPQVKKISRLIKIPVERSKES